MKVEKDSYEHYRLRSKWSMGLQILFVCFVLFVCFGLAWYFTDSEQVQEAPDWFTNMNSWLGPIMLGFLIFLAFGSVFTFLNWLRKNLFSL